MNPGDGPEMPPTMGGSPSSFWIRSSGTSWIMEMPIDINEYAGWGEDFSISPGRSVAFLSAMEEAGVRRAARACWNEDAAGKDEGTNGALPGRLDHLMTPAPFQPRAPWHVYRFYSQMTGRILPLDGTSSLKGFASFDPADGSIRILAGNPAKVPLEATLKLKGLDRLDMKARMKDREIVVGRIPFSGTECLSGPVPVLREVHPGSGRELVLPVSLGANEAITVQIIPKK